MAETTFGERLEKAIRSNYFTNKEVAQRANISPEAISHYLNAGTIPNGETVAALAKALNVTTDYLLGIDTPTVLAKQNIVAWLRKNASKLSSNDVKTIIGILYDNGSLSCEYGMKYMLTCDISIMLNSLNYKYKALSPTHIRCYYPNSDDYTMISVCDERNIVFGGRVIGDINALKEHLVNLKLSM